MENFEQQARSKEKRRVKTAIILLGVVGLLAVLVLFGRGNRFVVRDVEAYQAVFLDNGQVYFGKLKEVDDDFVSLTDIYYLRAGAPPQGGGSESSAQPSQIDLIKLGAELHAPRDEMIINKEHIVFYEDIGQESEIVRLIRQHKQGTGNSQ